MEEDGSIREEVEVEASRSATERVPKGRGIMILARRCGAIQPLYAAIKIAFYRTGTALHKWTACSPPVNIQATSTSRNA